MNRKHSLAESALVQKPSNHYRGQIFVMLHSTKKQGFNRMKLLASSRPLVLPYSLPAYLLLTYVYVDQNSNNNSSQHSINYIDVGSHGYLVYLKYPAVT